MKPVVFNDEQRRAARECSSLTDGVKQLRRMGLRDGHAIRLISHENPRAYHAWRSKPPEKQKPTDIARDAQRFAFRG
jgi:hypothetical protein